MRTQEAGTLVSASDLITVSDYFSFVGLIRFASRCQSTHSPLEPMAGPRCGTSTGGEAKDLQRPWSPSRPESHSGIGN